MSRDLIQCDRPKIPDVDADVVLFGRGFQQAVRVAVKVDRTPSHRIPCPERIVAKDEVPLIDLEFLVSADAEPSGCSTSARTVVVAGDQMFSAVQGGEDFVHTIVARSEREIAEMPHRVGRRYDGIPLLDQRRVMLVERPEWPLVDAQDANVPEVCVAGKKRGHAVPTGESERGCRLWIEPSLRRAHLALSSSAPVNELNPIQSSSPGIMITREWSRL